MRLWDIPRESKILLPIGGEDRESKDEMCTFHHIDGMYSLITTPDGHAVHLAAATPMKRVNDYYEMDE